MKSLFIWFWSVIFFTHNACNYITLFKKAKCSVEVFSFCVFADNGRLKYKISFEEKERSKCLVSGNHIAFDCMPHADQLAIGTRVLVKCRGEETRFCPGIVAELPNRKNRMRFVNVMKPWQCFWLVAKLCFDADIYLFIFFIFLGS